LLSYENSVWSYLSGYQQPERSWEGPLARECSAPPSDTSCPSDSGSSGGDCGGGGSCD
jgi:hypothetical protein